MTVRSYAFCAALMAAASGFPTTATPADLADPVAAWQADPTMVFDAETIDLDAFRWIARPIVVFADTPADPRFREQINLLTARPEELAQRDVVIITDTDPNAQSSVRETLRPRGFMLALLGKDGGVKLRKPIPWDVRELSRSIDKMPLRQDEIRAEQTRSE